MGREAVGLEGFEERRLVFVGRTQRSLTLSGWLSSVFLFVCLSFVVFSFKSFSFRDVTSSSFLRVIA